jgi:alpha-galactosidase
MARVRVAMRGAVLAPGETRVFPRLTIEAGKPAEQALDAAVERIRAIYHPPVRDEVLSGWCSWYYFYEKVTENDILANLRFLAEHRDRFPWQVVQIDDGYQRHWGDWLQPGSKFPHDMAWLAREIKKHGFRPGIWVAPLIMTAPSQLCREHADWALRRLDTGEPWTLKGWSPPEENPWFILDGTNPEYLEYVREVFSVMAHDWGYDYFKIDAMAFGAYAGKRRDSSQTGIQAVRKVVETIRAAVGPDKFVLGCGLPFGAAIGLVNGERVSDDISTAFRPEDGCCPLSVALPQTIHRSFIHGKWWHNDPDCVLVRADGTPHNPTLSEHGLTMDEAQLMVTVAGLTQGIQMIGENLSALTADRLALLDMICPMMPAPARPLDLFASKPDRLLTTTPQGEVLGLLNWSDEPLTLAVDPDEICGGRPSTVYEVWTDCFLGVIDRGGFGIEIPPHGARLLLLRPMREYPAFLGFDGHVSGGAALLKHESWDSASGTLRLDFAANRSGWVGIRVPAGWTSDSLAEFRGEYWTAPVVKGDNALELRFKRRVR